MSVFYPLPIILFCLLALVAEANSNKAIQSKEPWPEIIVSNLNADGPGSFTEALKFKGPKRVVFNVGGVIDLEKRSLVINSPYTHILGQTAPSPGITFIRGHL